MSVLLAAFVAAVALDGVDPALEERWRREYPGASARLEETAGAVVARGRSTFRAFDGERYGVDALTVATAGGDSVLDCDRRWMELKGGVRQNRMRWIRCQSGEAEFELGGVEKSNHTRIITFQSRDYNDYSLYQFDVKLWLKSAFMYHGIRLVDRMSHPSFVLKSISEVGDAGRAVVRIGYEYEGKYAFESGTVDLDPREGWAIRRVDIVATNKKRGDRVHQETDVEIAEIAPGRFFPRTLQFTLTLLGKESHENRDLEYHDIKYGPAPASMFKLSGYGLPDIPLRPTRRVATSPLRNPLFWVSLVGVLASCVFLVALGRRRGRLTAGKSGPEEAR